MGYDLTKNLVALRDQFNEYFPTRSKESDGWIGDTAHQSGKSGHNPDLTGNAEYKDGDSLDEVRAIDVTTNLNCSDPKVTMETVVQHLVKYGQNGGYLPLRYIIFNKRIWQKNSEPPWKQQAYTQSDPHTGHAHFSGDYSQSADSNVFNYRFGDIPMALTSDDKNWLKTTMAQIAGEALDVRMDDINRAVNQTKVPGTNTPGSDYLRTHDQLAMDVWQAVVMGMLGGNNPLPSQSMLNQLKNMLTEVLERIPK